MASVESRSKLNYKCGVAIGPKVNLFTFIIIILIIPGECGVSSEGKIFKRYKNASTEVCSLEDPSHVNNNVRSKQECVLLCQADPRCSGVNWKEPSVCEMYFFDPGRFGRTSRCSYFGPGEHFNLTKNYIDKFIISRYLFIYYFSKWTISMRRFEIENL